MERVVNITLYKDSVGAYSLGVFPLTTTVAPLDDEGAPVSLRWILRENPENPGLPDAPNARRLTVSFSQTPTPFSVVAPGEPPPPEERYSAPANFDGAEVVTPPVRDLDDDEKAIRLFKYTILVETNDNQELVVDPHVRWRRRKISRDTLLQD
ncbi:MAG: hypothetical protein HY011_33980 [Acidobacteria bacterium]|nr:hypothetical protein [Acidobacteriota bacterium]